MTLLGAAPRSRSVGVWGNLMSATSFVVSTLAFVAPYVTAPQAACSRLLWPPVMSRCEGGFNAFRQWPSEAAVSLTGRAQTFFGVGEGAQLTFTEIGELNKLDAGVLAGVMADMPMADQRGESVLLDAVDGQLEWITVVQGARALG